MNITKFIYTVECFHNCERANLMRGLPVHAAPGHFYCVDFDSFKDKSAFENESDPVEAAADVLKSDLGDRTYNARRFIEVCS